MIYENEDPYIRHAMGKYRCDKCIFRSDKTKYCKAACKKVEGHMICDAFRKRKDKTW
jgi:hypothetical protein